MKLDRQEDVKEILMHAQSICKLICRELPRLLEGLNRPWVFGNSVCQVRGLMLACSLPCNASRL